MPRQSDAERFGGTHYRDWKNWEAKAFGSYTPVQAVAFKNELARSGVSYGQRIRVLELGFGNGAFAGWARDQGWDYAGTELDPELVRQGLAWGLEAYSVDTPLETIAAGRKFDLVVAFDVLEHIDLDGVFRLLCEIKPNLAPGGRLVARLPSGDSPFSRAIQYGDITHKSIIGTGIVRQLAAASGLRVEQARAVTFPILGVGIVSGLRRLAVSGLRHAIRAIINVAFLDRGNSVVEANMVIVLTLPEDASR